MWLPCSRVGDTVLALDPAGRMVGASTQACAPTTGKRASVDSACSSSSQSSFMPGE